MPKFLIFVLLFFSFNAVAEESREFVLYKKVKCPTCAGQTIDESNTKASQILRDFIKGEVDSGKSNAEILAEVREYYGDSVVLETNTSAINIFIWLLPILLIIYSLNRVYKIYRASLR